MYVNIGENKALRKKDIVGVFDLDFTTVSVNTRNYLNKMQREGKVVTLGYNLPRSFILTSENLVYLSPLNVSSIK